MLFRSQKIFELVNLVSIEQNKRIATSNLMELINEATLVTPPPQSKGKRLKIRYVTQADVKPPTIIFFVNDPELMHFSYLRFLENRIRQVYTFKGTSLKLVVRQKE